MAVFRFFEGNAPSKKILIFGSRRPQIDQVRNIFRRPMGGVLNFAIWSQPSASKPGWMWDRMGFPLLAPFIVKIERCCWPKWKKFFVRALHLEYIHSIFMSPSDPQILKTSWFFWLICLLRSESMDSNGKSTNDRNKKQQNEQGTVNFTGMSMKYFVYSMWLLYLHSAFRSRSVLSSQTSQQIYRRGYSRRQFNTCSFCWESTMASSIVWQLWSESLIVAFADVSSFFSFTFSFLRLS